MSSPSAAGQNVTFPRKLYDLINNEPNHLIEWADHGESFFIRDQDEFSATVLAKYFRHTKLTSFQRQLNLYGFRRITKGPDSGAYMHPLFNRDDTMNLDIIKRVARKANSGAGVSERWQGARKIPSVLSGVSPNSPHSFPDPSISPSSNQFYGNRPSSWSQPGSTYLNTDGSTTDDEDEDDGDDGDETYHPSGRRRRTRCANTYGKPYYTRGGSADIHSEGRPHHRYRTRRAPSPESGQDAVFGNGGDYKMSQSAPNHGSSGWAMNTDSGSMPPPPPHFGGYGGQSRYPAQPGSFQTYSGPQSYPPHASGNTLFHRSTSAVSDINEEGDGQAFHGGGINGSDGGGEAGVGFGYVGDGGGAEKTGSGGGGGVANSGDFGDFDKSAMVMATDRVMSGSWPEDGGGGNDGGVCGPALDLDVLADLDEFNFETSFMMDL